MNPSVMAYASQIIGGKVLIAESSGETIQTVDPETVFRFLLEDWTPDDKRYSVIKVCWDLDQFVAPILRLLSRKNLEELASDNHRTWCGHYKLFYIPRKLFGITYGKYEANIYGINKYFKDDTPAKTVYDAAEYGGTLIYCFNRMGLTPKTLTSPIAVFADNILAHMEVPTIYDMPDYEKNKEAVQYAMNCMDREWRSVYQIGHWDKGECWDYDIVAAYPSVVRELRDTTRCQYIKSDKSIDSDWAYLRGKLTIDAPVHPFVDEEYGTAWQGTRENYFVTLHELNWLYKWQAGSFELSDGWFLRFDNNCRPFERILDRLFLWRKGQNDVNNDVMSGLSKSMSVGIYGKFAEEYDSGQYGKYYNPFYSAQIQAITRINVADFIYTNNLTSSLIVVLVDGVTTNKRVNLAHQPLDMGVWRMNAPSPALVLGSGAQFIADKRPYGVSYDQIINEIQAHPNKTFYEINNMKKRITLNDILTNDGDIKDIGKLQTYGHAVDLLGLEPDRVFNELPKTGRQLLNKKYTSEPISIGG